MLTNNHCLRNKNFCARIEVAHVEPCRGVARLVPQYAVTATYKNQESKSAERFFCFLEKNKTRDNFRTMTFRKSLLVTQYQMRYAIYIPLNAKEFTMNFKILADGNRQNAKKVFLSKQHRFVCEQ